MLTIYMAVINKWPETFFVWFCCVSCRLFYWISSLLLFTNFAYKVTHIISKSNQIIQIWSITFLQYFVVVQQGLVSATTKAFPPSVLSRDTYILFRNVLLFLRHTVSTGGYEGGWFIIVTFTLNIWYENTVQYVVKPTIAVIDCRRPLLHVG